MIDNKLLPKLSQNLLEILEDEEYYNITIEVGNDPYKNDETLINIKLPNILPETFQIILRYIYGGKLPLEEYDISDIIKILNHHHQMNEIQVWEHVIKWGLAQNPELPSDPTNFSKDDFNTLKNTLQQCIPYIKFRNLTSKEFLKKVKPYRKALPKGLYNDLLEYFSDNDYDQTKKSEPQIVKEIKSKNIDSKIITNQHVEIISRWIDRLKNKDKLTNSYEFKLLYHDNRDEPGVNRIKKFHEACDNKPRTIIVIKVKDRNEIFGGYNPIEWKSDKSYGITKDSFIFSFSNDSTENYVLSRVNDETKAVCNCAYLGPSFGYKDLCLSINLGGNIIIKCKKMNYEEQIIGNSDVLFLDFFEEYLIIYGEKLSLEEHGVSDIIKILVAANELSLQELIPDLESFLIENKNSWIEQNFDLLYQTSFENNSFLEL
ncbi:carbohydrate-binding module family 13 protein [Rhizophagus clarus]|uniref:Carbohydrate-binding module family 13 protein n=1 Tax=Rhizophagus clarus TaxID=94130 RepID=A0A8H3KYU9_9GLOM|nr:carbohydrate-binding module family 13 protein [Rhizophagus clarus]